MSSVPASTSAPTASGAPPIEVPPVAAAWQDRQAEAPWCPPELAEHLPPALAWVAGVDGPAQAGEAGDGAGWRHVAATRRGRVHAHAGDHREDAYAVVRTTAGVVIAVASDGAGSARSSRVGAEVTCREAARLAAEAVDAGEALGAALTAGVRGACAALRALAERAGVAAKDFRCTALAVALDPAAGVLAAVQVGDGVIAARAPDGAVRLLGAADAGEFSGEVSCFVPDACADARAAAVTQAALDDVDAVLVATDGVEDAVYPLARTGAAVFAQLAGGVGEGPDALLPGFQRQLAHGPVLGAGVAADEAADRLARWLTFEKRGENDDRTAVLLARHPA